MVKTQFRSMEGLALEIELAEHLTVFRPPAAIDRIAQKRMTEGRQMDPDLVCAARFEAAFDQRGAFERFGQGPVGDRALAVSVSHNGDFLAVMAGAREGSVHGAAWRLRYPCDYSHITAIDAVLHELSGQPLMRGIGLGDHEQPGRILVDPVDNPGARDSTDAREPSGAVVEERVDEGSVQIARRWVDDESRLLVDNEEMLILKDDREIDILSFVVRSRRSGDNDREALAFLHFGSRITSERGPARDLTRRNERFDSLPRQSRNQHRKRPVQPPTGHVHGNLGFVGGGFRIHRLGHAAMTILITSELHGRLLRLAEDDPAEEVCGLLYGLYNRIQAIELTNNVASNPKTHFEIDPAALIAAHRAARDGGLAIIGCFHSHPNGRTSPSPRDEAGSAGDGSLWLIIAAGIITGWRAVPGGFEPQPILLSE